MKWRLPCTVCLREKWLKYVNVVRSLLLYIVLKFLLGMTQMFHFKKYLMLGDTSAYPTYSPRNDCVFAASVFVQNCS